MNPVRALRIALPVALLGAAAWTVHAELRGVHLADVEAGIDALPAAAIWVAVALTAIDYLVLSGYDLLGLLYAGRRLPYPRVAFTAYVAYAFGNNIGFALLSSSSVRYRLYSQWGLSTLDITRVIAFTAVSLWAGLLPLAGGALLGGVPVALAPVLARALGVAALATTASYLVLAARGRSVAVRGNVFALPSVRLATAQVGISALDWALAALVLWVLFPRAAGVPFLPFLGVFVAAQIAGLLSQVPGGIGVFESVILAALAPAVPPAQVLSVLVSYRLIYYVGPFLVAFALLVGHEVLVGRRWLGRAIRGAHASFAPVVPWLAGAGALLAGAVLLVSGATPTVAERLHVLRHVLPLPVLEISHLVGSLAGTALLLLSRGLVRRLDGAWVIAVALLLAGAVASLAKGLDYEEAVLLLGLLVLLLPFRREFYRRSSLLEERFSPAWALTIGVILAASIWIGLFSYQHVTWSSELWFHFGFRGDAPRFLRATVAGVSLATLFAVAKLLRPAPTAPDRPGEAELTRARPIVARSRDTSARLALVGDKPLLFSPSGEAFLMYGVEGRTWVAMGDPVGPERDATDLAWRFRELSDRHGGWACFYQVGPGSLARYLDLGLALLKLGEEAIVPLRRFTLEGSERRPLRQAWNRAVRDGLCFDVVPPLAVPKLLPRLREISAAWLEGKRVREKGFSLGFFDERYLREGPVAIVRHGERVVAFANVWPGAEKAELSIDLMRYEPDAPRTTMDYLLVSLLLWGRAQEYEVFNLGMAPFSGFEDRALAPLWTKLGARVFRLGGNFYDFQGLRQYKEKFSPTWRARYLAAPGGLKLPVMLTQIAALVSRGLKGVVSR